MIHFNDLADGIGLIFSKSEFFSKLKESNPEGLVIILATHDSKEEKANQNYNRNLAALESLQDTLTSQSVPFAVFFTFETEEIITWYRMLAN